MPNTRTIGQRSVSRAALTIRAVTFALVVCPIGSAAFATPSQNNNAPAPSAQQVAVDAAAQAEAQ